MSLRQAWVFRCDFEECTEKVFGYIDSQKDAIDTAEKMGWRMVRYAGQYDCYCPDHAKVPETRSTKNGS